MERLMNMFNCLDYLCTGLNLFKGKIAVMVKNKKR